MFFPVDMREWLPDNHLVHFILEAVNQIGISSFKINNRGSGSEQFPPEMMLSLLIYSYVTGRFGSRTIEAATYTDVAIRYICGDKVHPDHSVICQFRKDNKEVFEETFTKVLLLAQQVGKLKKVGGISVDGTKEKAHASKHKAVSYKRAGEIIAELRGEVKELMKLAEDADGKGLEEELTVPEEIKRREDRIAALSNAREVMERMYEEAAEEGSKKGKKLDEYQHNFTDSDSRIMKAGNGKHFEQSYNGQAAVDTEGSMLILGGYVTQHGNDKQELKKIVDSVPEEVREVKSVSADCGFYNEEIIAEVEQVNADGQKEGPEVYCAVEKGKHGRNVDDLKKKKPMGRLPVNMSAKEKMVRKIKTKKGKAEYKKRKETVEPVFGIIKSVMGFRQFMLRGKEKVNTEWALVRAAYNFKRLHNLLDGRSLSKCLGYR
jgi:transposase